MSGMPTPGEQAPPSTPLPLGTQMPVEPYITSPHLPAIATHSWVYERIAVVIIVVAGAFVLGGRIVYAQVQDAGVASAKEAQRTADQAQEGVKRVAAALAEFKQEETSARQILAAKVGFVDQKIDMLLLDRGIRLPPPPAELQDGGR